MLVIQKAAEGAMLPFLLVVGVDDEVQLVAAADAAGFDDLAEFLLYVIESHVKDEPAREAARDWLYETTWGLCGNFTAKGPNHAI